MLPCVPSVCAEGIEKEDFESRVLRTFKEDFLSLTSSLSLHSVCATFVVVC